MLIFSTQCASLIIVKFINLVFQYLTFEEAVSKADSNNKHLLLGNGFSIDWKKDIFNYDALFDRADFSGLKVGAQSLFDSLDTKDFEEVIEALHKAKKLIEIYETTDPDLSKKFEDDADNLKEILANTIAKNHPEQPFEISKSEFERSRSFLLNFHGIYALNYDLLLYWVLMHNEDGRKINCDDGFRNSDDDSAEYVVWDNGKAHAQNVFYLHGALHLFDAGTELQKYTWKKTGVRLIEQIRAALSKNLFPLIVAEGRSEEKITHINHSGYLHKALRSFSSIGGSLFIHGHSLSDNDDHIIGLIPETYVNKLFVSFMTNPELPENASKVLKLNSLAQQRKNLISKMTKKKNSRRNELEIYAYDPGTAKVWRE